MKRILWIIFGILTLGILPVEKYSEYYCSQTLSIKRLSQRALSENETIIPSPHYYWQLQNGIVKEYDFICLQIRYANIIGINLYKWENSNPGIPTVLLSYRWQTPNLEYFNRFHTEVQRQIDCGEFDYEKWEAKF